MVRLRNEEPTLTATAEGRASLRTMRSYILEASRLLQERKLRRDLPHSYSKLVKRLNNVVTLLRKHAETQHPGILEIHRAFHSHIPSLHRQFSSENEDYMRLPEVKAWMHTFDSLSREFDHADILTRSPNISQLLDEIETHHKPKLPISPSTPGTVDLNKTHPAILRRSTADKDKAESHHLVHRPMGTIVESREDEELSSPVNSPLQQPNASSFGSLQGNINVDSGASLLSSPTSSFDQRAVTSPESEDGDANGLRGWVNPIHQELKHHQENLVELCLSIFSVASCPLRPELIEQCTAALADKHMQSAPPTSAQVKALVTDLLPLSTQVNGSLYAMNPDLAQQRSTALVLDHQLLLHCHAILGAALTATVIPELCTLVSERRPQDMSDEQEAYLVAAVQHLKQGGEDGDKVCDVLCHADALVCMCAKNGHKGLLAFLQADKTILPGEELALLCGVVEHHGHILDKHPSALYQVIFNMPRQDQITRRFTKRVAGLGTPCHQSFLQDSGHELVVSVADPDHQESYADLAKANNSKALTSIVTHPVHVTRFVAGGNNPMVTIWRMNKPLQQVTSLSQVGAETILGLAWSPDGLCIVVGCDGGTLMVLGPAGQGRDVKMEHQADISALAFSADSLQFCSCSADGNVLLWKREPVDEFADPQDPLPEYQHVAMAVEPGDAEEGSYACCVALVQEAGGQGDKLQVLLGYTDGIIGMWDGRDGGQVTRLARVSSPVLCLAVVESSKQVWVGCENGTVAYVSYDIQVKPTVHTVYQHGAAVLTVYPAYTGDAVWSIGGDGLFCVFEKASGSAEWTLVDTLAILAPIHSRPTCADIVSSKFGRPEAVIGFSSGAWKRVRYIKPSWT
eukprot:TRINITY_DN1535_c0_g1_i2.p1 TRINITY_DN1535_c0_g1~~TRINITY_DN1535_c0_g1_i2.p1  ORF type:complete len:857 (-),score=151.64 TRINITY_DN1535_c0_g1_i2:434-3004(-)